MTTLLKAFARDEEGATMVEYGILVGLIAAVSVGIIVTVGQQVLNAFTKVNTAMTAGGL